MPGGEIGDLSFTWRGERYIGVTYEIPLADRERLTADPSVQTAPMSLQRLFVFLTEAKEAERHG